MTESTQADIIAHNVKPFANNGLADDCGPIGAIRGLAAISLFALAVILAASLTWTPRLRPGIYRD